MIVFIGALPLWIWLTERFYHMVLG